MLKQFLDWIASPEDPGGIHCPEMHAAGVTLSLRHSEPAVRVVPDAAVLIVGRRRISIFYCPWCGQHLSTPPMPFM